MMRRRRSKAIVDGSSSRMNISRRAPLLLRHTPPQEDGSEEGKFPRPALDRIMDRTRLTLTSNHNDPAARYGNSHGYNRQLLATVAIIDYGANDGGQTALVLFIVLVGISFVLGICVRLSDSSSTAAEAARPISLKADADTGRRTRQPVFQVDSHTYQASTTPQPVHQVNSRTYQASRTPQPVFQIDSRTYQVIGGNANNSHGPSGGVNGPQGLLVASVQQSSSSAAASPPSPQPPSAVASTRDERVLDLVKSMTRAERRDYVANFLRAEKFANQGPTSDGQRSGNFVVTQSSRRLNATGTSDNDDDIAALPSCAICLEAFADGEDISTSQNAHCSHQFHLLCAFDWLLTSQECPCCRRDYLSIDQPPSHRGGSMMPLGSTGTVWADDVAVPSGPTASSSAHDGARQGLTPQEILAASVPPAQLEL